MVKLVADGRNCNSFLSGVGQVFALMSSDASPRPPRAVATPCIQVCVVDGESGLCLGCFRTLAEIAGWGALDAETRARLMAELPGRRDRIDPAKLGPG